MPLIRPGIRRLFDLMLRRADRTRRDVQAEVDLHLELRAAELHDRGLPPDEARAEAERRFGTMPRLEDSAHRRDRRMGMREWLESAGQDARYALRGLRREPLFTTFAITTLALGIGANAAMYGVLDRLLLRGPEHVREPERLVRFIATIPREGRTPITSGSLGYVSYTNLKATAQAFDGVAAYMVESWTLGRGREARAITAGFATADFFPLLGVRPALGRFFLPDEDDPSAPQRVVVLGDALWRGRFGGDSSVIGRLVDLPDGRSTVVGIAPAGFTGVGLRRVDAWIPMSVHSQNVTDNWSRAWNAQWLNVIGRLKPGVTPAAASAEATRAHLATYDGAPTRGMARAQFSVVPVRYTDRGVEPGEVVVSRWLVGVAVIVLLIAITNVSNLLLARAVRRRGEVGVRLALGAGRRRLARLFLTEGLLLSVLGGAAALLVAGAISGLVRRSLLTQVEWTAAPVSGRVLVLSLAVAIVAGALIGLLPALHATRVSVMQAIHRGSASGRRLGAGAWPTALQAGLAAVLVIGAGLFTRSLQQARTVPLGFDSDRVVVADVQWAPGTGTDDTPRLSAGERRAESWRQALERVRRLSGVEHAALAVGSPFGYSFGLPIIVAGWDSIPRLAGGGPYVSAVSSGYFDAVGTRLIRGRVFTPSEGDGTEPVAIVNETMARTLWPQQDAIGHCFKVEADTAPCARIVGIVEDARRYELREPASMQYYLPLGQERGFGGTVLIARPRGTPESIAPAVKVAVETGDASIEVAEVYPMRQLIDPLLRTWRLGATLFALGGGLALLVAVLGLYSVMSYAVAQRSHEMGVRMALGATTRQVAGLVVRQGLVMASVGLAAGVAVALVAGRQVEDQLFETSSRDPLVIGVTVATLLGAAALASLLPALRARRVDPIRALRAD